MTMQAPTPTNDDLPPRVVASRRRRWLVLGAFLAVCLAVGGLGGALTASSVGGWYQGLVKPSFNPPDWVFGPVWTALYLTMAVAAWRVWDHRQSRGRGRALTLFALQLALNALWSALFFGWTNPGAALVEIVLLLIAVLLTAASFARIDRIAGWLMAPYAAWVSFAVVLNAAIWWLN